MCIYEQNKKLPDKSYSNWAKNGDWKKALMDFHVYNNFDCLLGSLKLS